MALIEWRDDFEIGITAVDFEHRELIGMINELHAGLAHSPERDSVLAFLGEIYARISAHFALEEKTMREIGYQAFAEHKADHETLLDDIGDIVDDVENNDTPDYAKDLGERLQSWFTTHFSTHDARLHRFLEDGGG